MVGAAIRSLFSDRMVPSFVFDLRSNQESTQTPLCAVAKHSKLDFKWNIENQGFNLIKKNFAANYSRTNTVLFSARQKILMLGALYKIFLNQIIT